MKPIRTLLAVAAIVAGLDCAAPRVERAAPPPPPWDPVATFSILGYDPETGEVGGAVQSRVFCVGNGVLWAEAGVGAVATQAVVDVGYGPRAIALLREKMAPADVVARILKDDPDPLPDAWPKTGRQFAVIDAQGNVAAHTGEKAPPWAGHKAGRHCTAQGNILAGEKVVDAMAEAFEKEKATFPSVSSPRSRRGSRRAATRAECSRPPC